MSFYQRHIACAVLGLTASLAPNSVATGQLLEQRIELFGLGWHLIVSADGRADLCWAAEASAAPSFASAPAGRVNFEDLRRRLIQGETASPVGTRLLGGVREGSRTLLPKPIVGVDIWNGAIDAMIARIEGPSVDGFKDAIKTHPVRFEGAARDLVAFPGAEGFGRLATGGRFGDVYHVTNLADSGPGSLREGIRSATGPRTIVFEVGGTIALKERLVLDKSAITIAGQTAPGDGITLRDYTFQIKNVKDIVIQYLRFRLGDENKPKGAKGGDDTFNTEDVERVIVDHCSLSWAIDGVHDLRRGGNFTLQWCILSEALNQSLHSKGEHAMCASYRDLSGNISLHHNLFSTCRDRHPTLGSASVPPRYIVDFRNNVVYNWSAGGTANFADHFINCLNNVFRPGPMTDPARLPIALKGGLPDLAKGHMSGNVFEQRDDLTRDNYAALDFKRWLTPPSNYKYRGSLVDWRITTAPDLGQEMPRTQSAAEAAESVFAHAGASLHRDSVDHRVIDDVKKRRGRLIDSQAQVGGWPVLRSAPPSADRDRDGMPDTWEQPRGLSPADPADRNGDRDGDGHTNLEEYLNGLCPPQ